MPATAGRHANGTQNHMPVPGNEAAASAPGYQLIRRNGAVTPFDASKIAGALTKAFPAVEGHSTAASRRHP